MVSLTTTFDQRQCKANVFTQYARYKKHGIKWN